MDFLVYDLKVAALLAVFWLFWQLLAARETFHRLNRVVLLATAALSLVLPLCVVTVHRTVELPAGAMAQAEWPGELQRGLATQGLSPSAVPAALWGDGVPTAVLTLLFVAYVVGMTFCLARTLFSICKVRRLISRSSHHPAPHLEQWAHGHVTIAVTEECKAPFSWMRTIVMNLDDYADGDRALLAHECGHIRNHHSIDVIFVDVLTALQWFNPVAWLLRKDLRAIHEFEADAAVVSQGFNRYQYLQLLVRKAAGSGGYSIANGINNSTLKKRVTMMLKDKTPKHGWMRLLYVVPVVALSMVATAKTVVEYKTKSAQVATSIEEEPLISYSPTLVNRAHPQTGGAYMISVPREFQDVFKKAGSPSQGEFLVERNGRYKMAFYKATTTLMLNGEAFDEQSLPNLKADEVVMMDGGSMANGKTTLNFVTNPYKLSDEAFGRWVHRQRVAGVTQRDLTQKLQSFGPMPRKHLQMVNGEYGNADRQSNVEAEKVAGEDPVYDVVEHMPQFPGGDMKMMEFLMKTLKYPKEAQEKGITGRVVVRFVVEKDGSLSHLEVVKSTVTPGAGKGADGKQQEQPTGADEVTVNAYSNAEPVASPSKMLDDEALRVVRLMPKWQPAKHKGRIVRSRYSIPLTFRLN